MRKLTKMVSFRADLSIAEWLDSFNNGNKSQTINAILFVCMRCLSKEEFRSWYLSRYYDLENKKLALIDDDTPECNTDYQVNCNTLQQLNSEK